MFIFKEILNTPQYKTLLNLPKYKFLLFNPTAEVIDRLNSEKDRKYQQTTSSDLIKNYQIFLTNLKASYAAKMTPIIEMRKKLELPINKVLKSIKPILDYNEQISNVITKNYRAIFEAIKTNPIFKIDWKEVSDAAYQLLKEFDITLSNLSDDGWVLPTYYMSETNLNALNYINDLNEKEINKRMVSFYIRSDYKYLFEELDNLEEQTLEGFTNQVRKIKNVLETDMRNYTLCVPVLFTLLDGMYIKILGAELNEYEKEPNKITLSKYTLEFVKEHHLGEEDGLSYTKMILKNMFRAIEHKLTYTDFKKGDQLYSRHSVLHGAMSPDNYPFIEFLKLINLCSLFALLIES